MTVKEFKETFPEGADDLDIVIETSITEKKVKIGPNAREITQTTTRYSAPITHTWVESDETKGKATLYVESVLEW